ncbi:hypothetical protein LP414_21430 [Polaromonas sp. P1(28)-13]|nr:hypothetical protein LP414_21430 [Polaromonas sp. P1(28)-13]
MGELNIESILGLLTPGQGKGGACYEDVHSIEVLRIQNAARNATEWFENAERYAT